MNRITLAGFSAALPVHVVKCAKCGGQLRGKFQGDEVLIICDHCEYFTHASSLHRQLMADLMGQQLLQAQRN